MMSCIGSRVAARQRARRSIELHSLPRRHIAFHDMVGTDEIESGLPGPLSRNREGLSRLHGGWHVKVIGPRPTSAHMLSNAKAARAVVKVKLIGAVRRMLGARPRIVIDDDAIILQSSAMSSGMSTANGTGTCGMRA